MVFQSKGEDLRPLGVTGRTKDDLHEWSIYRQNVTCSIADGLFQIPGAIPPNAVSLAWEISQTVKKDQQFSPQT